jgi:hypothetical protein
MKKIIFLCFTIILSQVTHADSVRLNCSQKLRKSLYKDITYIGLQDIYSQCAGQGEVDELASELISSAGSYHILQDEKVKSTFKKFVSSYFNSDVETTFSSTVDYNDINLDLIEEHFDEIISKAKHLVVTDNDRFSDEEVLALARKIDSSELDINKEQLLNSLILGRLYLSDFDTSRALLSMGGDISHVDNHPMICESITEFTDSTGEYIYEEFDDSVYNSPIYVVKDVVDEFFDGLNQLTGDIQILCNGKNINEIKKEMYDPDYWGTDLDEWNAETQEDRDSIVDPFLNISQYDSAEKIQVGSIVLFGRKSFKLIASLDKNCAKQISKLNLEGSLHNLLIRASKYKKNNVIFQNAREINQCYVYMEAMLVPFARGGVSIVDFADSILYEENKISSK